MKVAIALITYKRPQALARLLASLNRLTFSFTAPEIEIVVVDNDAPHSAKDTLTRYTASGKHKLNTIVEPALGIPYARNAALKACSPDADFIAMLDDDEVVTPDWLEQLLFTIRATGADAVGGPVEPVYPADCPNWIIKGGFFARENWPDCQPRSVLITNNCLIRAETWRQAPLWFDTQLAHTGSSDTLFFMAARKNGWQLSWAATALVREHVPVQRLNAKWIVQRQYRIGNGLTLCAILVHGWWRTLPLRVIKSLIYIIAAPLGLIMYPQNKQATLVKTRARFARGCGGLSGLFGYRYEEYAPERLIGEKS